MVVLVAMVLIFMVGVLVVMAELVVKVHLTILTEVKVEMVETEEPEGLVLVAVQEELVELQVLQEMVPKVMQVREV